VAELSELETAIEGRQFVAHANSILETEATTDKVAPPPLPSLPQMAGLELAGAAPGPLVSRLDSYYEDPDLAKGKASLVNFPPEFAAIPCKPLFYDLALYHVAMPGLEGKLERGSAGGAAGQGLGSWLGGWGWGGAKK
jgi:signal recognition particle subunit SRP68